MVRAVSGARPGRHGRPVQSTAPLTAAHAAAGRAQDRPPALEAAARSGGDRRPGRVGGLDGAPDSGGLPDQPALARRPGHRRTDPPLRDDPPRRTGARRCQEAGQHPRRRRLARPRPGAPARATARRTATPTAPATTPGRANLGYCYVHSAVDAFSRLAYSEALDDETAATALAFWTRARTFFAGHGITVERVLTDNGSAYRSHAWRDEHQQLGIRHSRTRPRRPQTNGKVERLNRTLLEEWAYRRLYTSEKTRRAALSGWLHHYNHHRPHTALGNLPPISRCNRDLWTAVNAEFTDADAQRAWAADAITWGLFKIPERELAVLGELPGRDVVELGCGSAYFSAWLARRGARPVGVDLTPAQLATARRCQKQFGLTFPLVEANAEDVPLPDNSFDLAISEYGASVWCDPELWIAEAARRSARAGAWSSSPTACCSPCAYPSSRDTPPNSCSAPNRTPAGCGGPRAAPNSTPGTATGSASCAPTASCWRPCTSSTPRPPGRPTTTTRSEFGHHTAPPGLVGGAQTGAVVPVVVLVEEDQVPPGGRRPGTARSRRTPGGGRRVPVGTSTPGDARSPERPRNSVICWPEPVGHSMVNVSP